MLTPRSGQRGTERDMTEGAALRPYPPNKETGKAGLLSLLVPPCRYTRMITLLFPNIPGAQSHSAPWLGEGIIQKGIKGSVHIPGTFSRQARHVRHHTSLEIVPPHLGGGGGLWGGVWHKASVSICLPLAAPIGLSPMLILTLCGPERVLVVNGAPG